MPKSLRSSRHDRLLAVLVETRKAAEITQAVLAERLKRPQSFVAKTENGERRLDVIEFIEMTEALDADPHEVFAAIVAAKRRRR